HRSGPPWLPFSHGCVPRQLVTEVKVHGVVKRFHTYRIAIQNQAELHCDLMISQILPYLNILYSPRFPCPRVIKKPEYTQRHCGSRAMTLYVILQTSNGDRDRITV